MAAICQRTAFQARLLKEICMRSISRRTVSSLHTKNFSMPVVDKQGFFKPEIVQKRFYQIRDIYEPSPNAPRPGRKDYEERVMKALNTFDRFPKEKTLTLETHFTNDMGLDSLDHVELIVALEAEFNCEIPDDVAEKLMTPKQMLDYFCEKDKVPEKRTEYGEGDPVHGEPKYY